MTCKDCLKMFLIFSFLCKCLSSESSDVIRNVLHSDVNDIEDEHLNKTVDNRYETWIFSLLASCVIGCSGIVPLIFIPFGVNAGTVDEHHTGKLLRLLLSFAVGGLLGDVFLHLLPEAWSYQKNLGAEVSSSQRTLGLWVLSGMFSFVILEIMFAASKCGDQEQTVCNAGSNASYCKNEIMLNGKSSSHELDANGSRYLQKNPLQNGHSQPTCEKTLSPKSEKKGSTIHIAGYLNLMANSVDNFTHGLAVAASFLVGYKMGVLTTFAILIHEIPHEIGDFAILLKSGFHPWTAAKAQISTATIGMFGVIVALSVESIDQVGACISWILPFTAGGFLNIALVNVLPDLLTEKDPWESIKQVICICAGIGVMAVVSSLA